MSIKHSKTIQWVLWKARCKCVFEKVEHNALASVKEIWLMLLHEAIIGEPEVVIRKQFRDLHLF